MLWRVKRQISLKLRDGTGNDASCIPFWLGERNSVRFSYSLGFCCIVGGLAIISLRCSILYRLAVSVLMYLDGLGLEDVDPSCRSHCGKLRVLFHPGGRDSLCYVGE
jgi:hypothetical protein